MTFVSGSRTGEANPAEALYNVVAGELTAHANWTFVETWDAGASARWHVWKCGTANSAGVEFHVLLGYSPAAGATGLGVALVEGYRTTDHMFNHPAPYTSSSNFTPAADSSYGGTTYYAAPANVQNYGNLFVPVQYTSASAFDYWIAVNNDGLMLVSRTGTSSYPVILGTYDSLIVDSAVNDPYPLVISQMNTGVSSSTPSASATRHPMVTTAQPRLFGVMTPAMPSMTWLPAIAGVGQAGIAASGDVYLNNEPSAGRAMVMTWSGYYGNPAVVGKVRGLYRHIINVNPGSGVAVGDTISMGGETYMYLGSSGGWDTPWYKISAA